MLTVDFNTIMLVGLAPKGPAQVITVCGSDTDDSQFGSCLTGFTIPRALSDIRLTGAGKVAVLNVYDEATHAVAITNENCTVQSQKTKTLHNPVNTPTVKNTPVSPVSAVAATAALAVTVAAESGDTLDSLEVDGTELLGGTITFTAGTLTETAQQIVDGINAETGTTGFSATIGSNGAFTITAPTALGDTINGEQTVIGTLTGDIEIGTNGAFANGVTAVAEVVAVTYVAGTDYTIDDYGNIVFLIPITNGTVIRVDYKRLDPTLVTASHIIGSVDGTTRTGCKLIDKVKSSTGLVPKILIIPVYNQQATVKTEMERLQTLLRMRGIYTSSSLTLAQAIAARQPGGALATFNTSNKRSILVFNRVKTYDPQTATNTLTDASPIMAGWMARNAAINTPANSPSNEFIPGLAGVEVELNHQWEDVNSAADTNQLRSQGIVSIFNDGGYRWWGGENSSYPTNNAVDGNISVMYVSDIINDSLTAFAKERVDRNITTGSIAAFLTEANGYYSRLASDGWIGPDSNVKYLPERNPANALAAGTIKFTKNTFYYVGAKLIQMEENLEVQLPNIA